MSLFNTKKETNKQPINEIQKAKGRRAKTAQQAVFGLRLQCLRWKNGSIIKKKQVINWLAFLCINIGIYNS